MTSNCSLLNKKHQRGFNLVELMFALAVAAILVGLGAPPLQKALDRRALVAETDRLTRSINFARSEAINKQQIVGVEAKSVTTDWAEGWNIFTTTTATVSTAYNSSSDTLVRDVEPAGGQKTMTGSAARVKFNQLGRLVTGSAAVTISVCESTDDNGINGSLITISLVGRPSTTTIASADKASDC